MSSVQEVEVTIARDGRVQVHVQGVKGRACLDITREMEQLLGNEIANRRFTYEYDEQPLHGQQGQVLRQGDD